MKKIDAQRLMLVGAVAFLIFFVQGCATATPAPHITQLSPIKIGPEGSAPIIFTRLIIRIPLGTQVGAAHIGWAKGVVFRYTWQSDVTVGSDEFKNVASEHLKSRGYTVPGVDDLFFGRDESAKAEYQLGGTVHSLVYNTYAPTGGRRYSEAALSIEWQLYDSFSKQVVMTVTTSGYGKQPGMYCSACCFHSAFRSALDNLLANRKFVEFVKRSTQHVGRTNAR
jgi:hypothetical protein